MQLELEKKKLSNLICAKYYYHYKKLLYVIKSKNTYLSSKYFIKVVTHVTYTFCRLQFKHI